MPPESKRSESDRQEFIERYGGIYEHSPWVAAEAYGFAAGVTEPDALAAILARCVDEADHERKLALIRAHPDLAGKAAISGALTRDSSAEQASAGIDQCTRDEFERFLELNNRYRKKFGFPFVMAVRHSNRQEILAAFARRLENDGPTEFETAIDEIHKIALLRLQELAS